MFFGINLVFLFWYRCWGIFGCIINILYLFFLGYSNSLVGSVVYFIILDIRFSYLVLEGVYGRVVVG